MSYRFDAPLIAGAYHLGNRGLGVLGSEVPSTGDDGAGFLYNDLSLPADANKEVRGEIVSLPATGTLFVYEDSSFDWEGGAAPDSFTYRLWVDGVDDGTAVVDLASALIAAQELPVFGQAFAAGVASVLSGVQELPRFGQAATISAVSALIATQELRVFGQSAQLLGQVTRNVSALQALVPFGQAAAIAVIGQAVVAPHELPVFGQVATAVSREGVFVLQELPAFGQVARLVRIIPLEFDPLYVVRARARHYQVSKRRGQRMLSPKDQDEFVVITFDFSDLDINPTAPSVTIRDDSGTDTNATALLQGVPIVAGTSVMQLVGGGVKGVYYSLRCEVDDGSEHFVLDAVLPVV